MACGRAHFKYFVTSKHKVTSYIHQCKGFITVLYLFTVFYLFTVLYRTVLKIKLQQYIKSSMCKMLVTH